MKLAKRFLSLALVVLMALSVVGCHKKDEIAIKVGDFEFTAAYYMCALIYADTDARALVDEQLAEKKEKDKSIDTENIDYSKQKIDGKSFDEYVKDKALESIRRIAAYKTKCAELKLKLEDEIVANAESYAEYYWSGYGYSQIFEPNGVSLETMKTHMLDTYYASIYFNELYGEGGEREIASADLQKALADHFVLANVMEAPYKEDADDTSKADLKEKLDAYANALNSGTMTYEQVDLDFYGPEEEKTEEETQTETEKPMDEKATILGDEDTQYSSEYYEAAKKLEKGVATVVNMKDGSGITLIYKKEISEDPYYLKNLDNHLRELLEAENLEKEMKKFAKTLDFKEIKSATKIFKVKNIKHPEVADQAAQTAVQ